MITLQMASLSDEDAFKQAQKEGVRFDSFGVSQLIAAIDLGRLELATKLASLPGMLDSSALRSPLGAALESDYEMSIELVEMIVKKSSLDRGLPPSEYLPEFTEGLTHAMARRLKLKKLQLLADLGFDMNAPNSDGETCSEILANES